MIFFGKYITQGRLDITGCCGQTSLEKLDGLGLKSLCPWLCDHVQPGPGDSANRMSKSANFPSRRLPAPKVEGHDPQRRKCRWAPAIISQVRQVSLQLLRGHA